MVRYVRLEATPLNIAWLPGTPHLAASCADGKVRIVNADTVQVTQTLPALNGWAYAITVDPSNESVVVGGSHGKVRRIAIAP